MAKVNREAERVAHQIKPLPETVAHVGPFKVRDLGTVDIFNGVQGGSGHTELESKLYAVPTDMTETSRAIRLHESGHLAWSPKRFPECDFDPKYLQVAEDCRINSRLARHLACAKGKTFGYTRVDAQRELKIVRDLVQEHGPKVLEILVCTALARQGLRHGKELWQLVEDLLGHIKRADEGLYNLLWWGGMRDIDLTRQEMRDQPMPFSSAKKLAQLLAALFGEQEPETKTENHEGEENPNGDRPERVECTRAMWGPLKLLEPDLTEAVGRRVRRMPRTVGCIPMHMHRYAIDGAVFDSVNVSRPHGSVLVDCSGSMCLEFEEVRALALAYPRAVVAIYADHAAVVLKDGRCADEAMFAHARQHAGGGNRCDLPALEWLGTQSGPRLWITDGGVCGTNGPSGAHTQACLKACERLDISRHYYTRNMDEALRALREAR